MSKKSKPAQDAAATQIYCGPSIPGVASLGMLFEQLPPPMLECIEQCPAIGDLIADVREYVRVKNASEQKGSFLYMQRQEVLCWLSGR